MNLKTLITLGTALAIGALPYAAFSADQKAPAKVQAPAAGTAQTAAAPTASPVDKGAVDKGAPDKPTAHKKTSKKKHTDNKS